MWFHREKRKGCVIADKFSIFADYTRPYKFSVLSLIYVLLEIHTHIYIHVFIYPM